MRDAYHIIEDFSTVAQGAYHIIGRTFHPVRLTKVRTISLVGLFTPPTVRTISLVGLFHPVRLGKVLTISLVGLFHLLDYAVHTTLLVGLFDYEHMPVRLPATRVTVLPWGPHAVLLNCVSRRITNKEEEEGNADAWIKGGKSDVAGRRMRAVGACDQRPPAQQTLVVERSE